MQSDGIHTKPLSVVLNPLRNDHIVYVDANSILSNYHQYGILNNYSVTNDDEYYFFSAHQLSMYAMAHFHSLDDVANEIKQYTNHFELYHKKIEISPNFKWYDCREDKMRDVLLLKWLWCNEFREALDNEK